MGRARSGTGEAPSAAPASRSASACRPVALAGPALTLAFGADSAFLLRKAEDQANKTVVAEALRAVTGQVLAPAFEIRDDLPSDEPTPPTEQEWVERFKLAFSAEEIPDDEPQEPA